MWSVYARDSRSGGQTILLHRELFYPHLWYCNPRIIDIYLYSRFDKIIDLFAVPLALPVVFAALEDCLNLHILQLPVPPAKKQRQRPNNKLNDWLVLIVITGNNEIAPELCFLHNRQILKTDFR